MKSRFSKSNLDFQNFINEYVQLLRVPLFVFSKKVLTSCLIVTLLARIFDSHGDILHVITNDIII